MFSHQWTEPHVRLQLPDPKITPFPHFISQSRRTIHNCATILVFLPPLFSSLSKSNLLLDNTVVNSAVFETGSSWLSASFKPPTAGLFACGASKPLSCSSLRSFFYENGRGKLQDPCLRTFPSSLIPFTLFRFTYRAFFLLSFVVKLVDPSIHNTTSCSPAVTLVLVFLLASRFLFPSSIEHKQTNMADEGGLAAPTGSSGHDSDISHQHIQLVAPIIPQSRKSTLELYSGAVTPMGGRKDSGMDLDDYFVSLDFCWFLTGACF